MKLFPEYLRKPFWVLAFLWVSTVSFSQELNCLVSVNSELVDQTNQQVFKTLERSLNDYVNKTKWTNKKYSPNERINCSMLITINSYESNRFTATLQVQSSRPTYNSNYQTPIFNYNDRQFTFNYVEFQPLFFNPTTFDSNLVAVITYYVYVILGLDADTFALEGGTEYYKKAQDIVNLAQSSSFSGWKQADGNRTRWELIDNLTSNTFREYRIAMYNYHRKGLDVMVDNNSAAKQTIAGCMRLFDALAKRRPNSFLVQTFFDAKADEIQQVFSGGPKMNIVNLVEILNRVAPYQASTWQQIKY
jgi:hypothetical protein